MCGGVWVGVGVSVGVCLLFNCLQLMFLTILSSTFYLGDGQVLRRHKRLFVQNNYELYIF